MWNLDHVRPAWRFDALQRTAVIFCHVITVEDFTGAAELPTAVRSRMCGASRSNTVPADTMHAGICGTNRALIYHKLPEEFVNKPIGIILAMLISGMVMAAESDWTTCSNSVDGLMHIDYKNGSGSLTTVNATALMESLHKAMSRADGNG